MSKSKWQYRFGNYNRAYFLLREACDVYDEGILDQLSREGMIHRFEFCTEMAWKTMQDYLEHHRHVFARITPLIIIRTAADAKLIDDADAWTQILDTCNRMSRAYDFELLEEVAGQVSGQYIHYFTDLYDALVREALYGTYP